MNRADIITASAPGRVCLFGEHQDYLKLPVIAAAIDRHITIRAQKNGTQIFKIAMPDIGQTRQISLQDDLSRLDKRDYLKSVFRVLRRYGCIPGEAYDITISGTIPVNAGASSSSALTVAWVRLLIELFGIDRKVTPELIAYIAYEAEVLEHGEPGGMMDQYAISCGNVVLIETLDNGYNVQTLADHVEGLVLGESKMPKETLQVLAVIRQNVNRALEIIQQKRRDFVLYDATPDDIEPLLRILPADVVPFFEAAVRNYAITRQAIEEFGRSALDLRRIGELMTEHHRILRDCLKISTARIDSMIEAALDAGAQGAKINGSGGGGTVVILAKGCESRVIRALRKLGAEGYSVKVVGGASVAR